MTISKLLNSTDVHTVQRKVNEIIDEVNTGVTIRNVEITRTDNYYCKTYDEYNSETGAYIGKWCEQGCFCDTSSSAQGYTNIRFLKSFGSNKYTFNFTPLFQSAPVSGGTFVEIYPERFFDGTTIYSSAQIYGYSWVASGYIASRVEMLVKETTSSQSATVEFQTSDDEPFVVSTYNN